MKSAVLVIDLVNDTFAHDTPLARAARGMLPQLNDFLDRARRADIPVIYSTDSFLEGDFIFRGRMKPHSIRGDQGAEVAAGIRRAPEDVWLPKRRLSAFYKTDLDQTLRLWEVERVGVCGAATNFCVLMTALDAVSRDFAAVILEDLCVAASPEIHHATLELYRKNVLDPIFRVLTGDEFMDSLGQRLGRAE